MNEFAVESSTGSSSARKAERIFEVAPSSIRHTFHGILHRYPYKLQSLQELQPGDTAMRASFTEWATTRIESDPQ
ncbi:hypothetical protein TNIN_209371 [Trichonephila inaurata madagascariensis]|uniref:Uncharacterized protein n=1 Tax=Trichonephila inaurata madagascariensis TaxID=2747483 RepID=A0A8X6XA88_9ARAC|nr:hypothetical protein TNIN_209371 [Trichonephila inaurata madagascariensis]